MSVRGLSTGLVKRWERARGENETERKAGRGQWVTLTRERRDSIAVEGTSRNDNLAYQVDPRKVVEFDLNGGFWDFDTST